MAAATLSRPAALTPRASSSVYAAHAKPTTTTQDLQDVAEAELLVAADLREAQEDAGREADEQQHGDAGHPDRDDLAHASPSVAG